MLPELLWYQKGIEFGKDSVKRKGYWLSGTKAEVWEVQRVPESACVLAHVIQGEPKVGLQLTGLGYNWKEIAEDGISLELWLQDLQPSPGCCV